MSASDCGSLTGRVRSRTASSNWKIAAFAPLPSARIRTAVMPKPGPPPGPPNPQRTSCHKRSNGTHPQASWVCSRIRVAFPNARRAAKWASFGDMPRSHCSSSSRSRSDLSSRSRSAFRFLICHHRISTLLSRGPHHQPDSFGHLLPLGFFDHKLLLTLICQSVVLEFPISIRSRFPFSTHPSSLLQTMQRGIERTVLHLQEVIRRPLNVLSDLMTMCRSMQKRSQDEHVESPLEKSGSLLYLFRHRRQSTLSLTTMVDTRQSNVKLGSQLRPTIQSEGAALSREAGRGPADRVELLC